MKSMPRLSILIPVHNAEKTLEFALDSLLTQTFTDFELLILNDGSEDSSMDIMQRYERLDKRVRIFRNLECQGLAAARNDLLAAQDRGCEFTVFASADNVSMPDRFERQIAFMDAHPDVAALGTAVDVIADGGAHRYRLRYPTKQERVRRYAKHRNPVMFSTVVLRNNSCWETGGFNPKISYAEDYDFILRLLEHHAVTNLPEALVTFELEDELFYADILKNVLWQMLPIQGDFLRTKHRYDVFSIIYHWTLHGLLFLPPKTLQWIYLHINGKKIK